MKKIKDVQTPKINKDSREPNIPLKAKTGSAVNKNILFPEEFEEDRSMNIRMKPQPFTGKKINGEKK